MKPESFDYAAVDQGMLETLTTISDSPNYNAWVYSQFKEHLSGVVLDVGSGIGDIVNQYVQNGAVEKVIATDYSGDMIVRLKERFRGDPRYKVLRMDIMSEESLQQIEEGSVDVITCSNVLEHIEDHSAALVRMKSLLKKDGKLIILVPALPFIYGTLDVLVGHYRRYTKKTLGHEFQKAGFFVHRHFYMNVFGVVTWFLAGRVFKHKGFDKNSCRRLDKIVPFLQMIESGVKPLWGQSLVVVGQKQ